MLANADMEPSRLHTSRNDGLLGRRFGAADHPCDLDV